MLTLAARRRIVTIPLILVGFLGCTVIRDAPEPTATPLPPEDVALMFLAGDTSAEDIAPDGRYESVDPGSFAGTPMDWAIQHIAGELSGSQLNPFDDMWAIRRDPRTEYAMEIDHVIVRDSQRPNSKEVTIMYHETFNQILPPWSSKPLGELTTEDLRLGPTDDWSLTGEHVSRSQVAFFIIEDLGGRWVVWCAEIDKSPEWVPDICKYSG